MRLLHLVGALLLGGLLFAGTQPLQAQPSELRVRGDQAPGGPLQVTRGEKLFEACAQCHGPQGEGRVGKAPRLRGDGYLAVVSNDYLHDTIRQGRPGTDMIAWGSWMPPEDTRALVAYLRSWQRYSSVELDESPLEGDAGRGADLFASRCAECHGDKGLGYAEGAIGLGIGRFWFLEQASDGMIRAFVLEGKPDTPMPGFGHESIHNPDPLTAEDVDSIIAWLRANPR